MPEFKFYHPIEVRYGDLDPQGHVNNAAYLTFLEQARIQYFHQLGLWAGGSFLDLGIIMAEIKITFRAPILFGQAVRVGARITYIGNKSLEMHHCMEDIHSGAELAHASSVLVTYDYHTGKTIPVPEAWKQAITSYEQDQYSLPGNKTGNT